MSRSSSPRASSPPSSLSRRLSLLALATACVAATPTQALVYRIVPNTDATTGTDLSGTPSPNAPAPLPWLDTGTDGATPHWRPLPDTENAEFRTRPGLSALEGAPTSAYVPAMTAESDAIAILPAQWDWRRCCSDDGAIVAKPVSMSVNADLASYSGIGIWYFLVGDVVGPTPPGSGSVTDGPGAAIALPGSALLLALGAALFRRHRRTRAAARP